MAELEKHAIKRDRGFLVKLVLLLGVGILAGVLLLMQTEGVGAWVADGIDAMFVDQPPPPSQ